jgi:hypothetical protein
MHHFSPSTRLTNIMRLPPISEFAALAAEAGYEFDEGGITRPQIMRGAELRDDAPRDRRPVCAKERACLGIGQHEEQNVAVLFLQTREVGEGADG